MIGRALGYLSQRAIEGIGLIAAGTMGVVNLIPVTGWLLFG